MLDTLFTSKRANRNEHNLKVIFSYFQERILPSQETFHPPTLPPLFYSSPIDDVIGGREARRPEQYSQNGRNAYDLVVPGVAETGKLLDYINLI